MSDGTRGQTLLWMPLLALLALPAGRPVSAQNLIVNPHFHTDTEGWDLFEGTSLQWTSLADEGQCDGSGSALVMSEPNQIGDVATLMQCVEVQMGAEVYAQVRHLGYGNLTLRLVGYATDHCSGGSVATAIASAPQSVSNWSTLQLALFPPKLQAALADPDGGVGYSMRIVLSALDDDPHGLSLDAVLLTYFEPIFLDGFEGNEGGESAPCRWGSS